MKIFDSTKNIINNIKNLTKDPKFFTDSLVNSVANLGYESKLRQGYYGSDLQFTRNWVQLDNLYRSNWLAQRIIDLPADDMTREWIKLKMEISSQESDKISKYEEKLFVQNKVNESIKWSRLYGGALMVMNFGDQQDTEEPLNPDKVDLKGLKSLHILTRWQVTPYTGTKVSDMESPEFGLPEYYIINSSEVGSGVKVHYSRCIRFISHDLPWRQKYLEQYWGNSELERVMQALLRYDTTTDGTAELTFLAAQRYFGIDGYRDLVASGQVDKAIASFQALAMLASYNRIFLFDKKDEFGHYDYKFEGLPKIIEQFMMDVSGAAEIPITKLFGRSPAGMNATGESDIRNYYDTIRTKQKSQLKYQLSKLYRILIPSAIGYIPEDFGFEFINLWQLTDEENAKKVLAEAQADQIYLDKGVLTEIDVANELKNRGYYQNVTIPEVLKEPEAEPELEQETEEKEPNDVQK